MPSRHRFRLEDEVFEADRIDDDSLNGVETPPMRIDYDSLNGVETSSGRGDYDMGAEDEDVAGKKKVV